MKKAAAAIRGQQFPQAAELLEAVVAGQPDYFEARWLLARCLEQMNAVDDVQAQLDELLKRGSDDLAKINQIAEFVRRRGYPLESVNGAYRRFLEHSPDSAVAAYNLAWYLAADGEFDAAIEAYQRALDLGIERSEEVHLNIASLYMDHLQDSEKAKQHLDSALAANPAYVQAHLNLGNLAERLGDRGEASRCFEKCLELEPENEYALARLADAHRFSNSNDPLLSRLSDRAPDSRNADLHYALGRAYDQIGSRASAWAEFATANELDRAARPAYRRSHSEALVQRIITRCNAGWLSRFGGESHRAVFLCGMFRSGSTLLERILAAHPAFAAGGESDFFPRLAVRHFRNYPDGLERLTRESIDAWMAQHAALCDRVTGGRARMTDKRPDNFLRIGLIKAILPGARFVVTERDWRDVAISIFGTRLGPGQGYATRLEDIRHYLELHRQLVDHWAELLGDDLIRVPYEALVTSPRETVGAVLNSLGEPWDDNCLAFDRQEGAVGTASVWQVREPLHRKAIGRWRGYERYFRDTFGDDVDD